MGWAEEEGWDGLKRRGWEGLRRRGWDLFCYIQCDVTTTARLLKKV